MVIKRVMYLILAVSAVFLSLFAALGLKSTFNLYPTVSGEQAKQDIEQGIVTKIIASEESNIVKLYYPAPQDGENIKIVSDISTLPSIQPETWPDIVVERTPSWTPYIQASLFLLVGLCLATIASRVISRR